MQIIKDTTKHPCFNKASKGSCGRVHLPVAPKCNIQCNYCNRKYDCVNESRPGVTSAILTPQQAVAYMDKVLEAEPRITVAGIAGPGDPMANPEEVLETMRLLKAKYPHLLFCLSSNGMRVPEHIDELAALGVTHLTITMNAVDPKIGGLIYRWARDGKTVYQGEQAAAVLIEKQKESIRRAKALGMLVKVNSIIIPGINDQHLTEVTQVAAALGADIQNLLPLHPAADTPFADVQEPDAATVAAMRQQAAHFMEQMTHCKRCRADAVGLLDADRSAELCPTLQACAAMRPESQEERQHVAVASREGMLINQHLGEATTFSIWGKGADGYTKLDERHAPAKGCGDERWNQLASILHDCRALLVSASGANPKKVLGQHGIDVHDASGLIAPAVEIILENRNTSALTARRPMACTGGGGGCG